MFECDDFNTNFTFYDPKNRLTLSDKARISFIELPKVMEITPEQIKNDACLAWAAFFNAKRKETIMNERWIVSAGAASCRTRLTNPGIVVII